MSDKELSHSSHDKLPFKLEGANNYNAWSVYVKAALKSKGLYGHITGATTKPATTTPANSKQADEWERCGDKAQSIIMLGVVPALINHIAGDMTAKQMWDKLAVQCRRRTSHSCVTDAAAIHHSSDRRRQCGSTHLYDE